MALCPACKTEQKKRVGGACPNCRTPVEIHNGLWFRAGTGSPNVAVLKYFEALVSSSLSKGRPNKVVFVISKIGPRYKRELVAAERLLLLADHNIDLVKAALDILFTDKRSAWKTRDSLLFIETEFTTALALARANQAMKERAEEDAKKVLEQVSRREDVFA